MDPHRHVLHCPFTKICWLHYYLSSCGQFYNNGSINSLPVFLLLQLLCHLCSSSTFSSYRGPIKTLSLTGQLSLLFSNKHPANEWRSSQLLFLSYFLVQWDTSETLSPLGSITGWICLHWHRFLITITLRNPPELSLFFIVYWQLPKVPLPYSMPSKVPAENSCQMDCLQYGQGLLV